MKQHSAAWWKRAARAAELVTGDDLKAHMRAQLDGNDWDKAGLAAKLGISTFRLTLLLRSDAAVPDKVAERLGFRKVVRFEPMNR